jgi:hypothetical protein
MRLAIINDDKLGRPEPHTTYTVLHNLEDYLVGLKKVYEQTKNQAIYEIIANIEMIKQQEETKVQSGFGVSPN